MKAYCFKMLISNNRKNVEPIPGVQKARIHWFKKEEVRLYLNPSQNLKETTCFGNYDFMAARERLRRA